MTDSYKDLIPIYKDFPKFGVGFCDISPLLGSPQAWASCMSQLSGLIGLHQPTHIMGMDARGFLIGISIAERLALPFVMARKPGKLPGDLMRAEYNLEYGSAELSVQVSAFPPGSRIAIVDDVLATGGTMEAAMRLVSQMKSTVTVMAVLVEIEALNGYKRLEHVNNSLFSGSILTCYSTLVI